LRRLRSLSRFAPRARTTGADLLVLAGAAVAVRGLALVWAPLAWLAAGVAIAAAGVLLSPKKKPRRSPDL
jgi:hypothetical protein